MSDLIASVSEKREHSLVRTQDGRYFSVDSVWRSGEGGTSMYEASKSGVPLEFIPHVVRKANEEEEMMKYHWEICTNLERYLGEETPKGKWIDNGNGTFSCNRCHSWIPEEQRHYARFCLFCGAVMEEEREDSTFKVVE